MMSVAVYLFCTTDGSHIPLIMHRAKYIFLHNRTMSPLFIFIHINIYNIYIFSFFTLGNVIKYIFLPTKQQAEQTMLQDEHVLVN